jgi:GT2 family glycosyltransferase
MSPETKSHLAPNQVEPPEISSGVSIVIPTWNGIALLKQFLPSVIEAATCYTEQFSAPVEIIIVDDDSTDETIEWLVSEGFSGKGSGKPYQGLKPFHEFNTAISNSEHLTNQTLIPALHFVRNETNRGFGETCNRGFEAANYPLVLLLNNDVEIARDSVFPLVENFADENVFAAHCRVFELDGGRECGTGKLGGFARGFLRVHRSYAWPGDQAPSKIERKKGNKRALYSMFAGGGSAMFDREKFFAFGGFEPLLSPFYWEDVELSYRAWKRGFKVMYEPRAVARHRVSSTIGKMKRSKVKKIEQRNRLIFHWINLHDKKMLASHIAWMILVTLTAPLRLRPGFISSVAMAIKSLPQILCRRREEKRAAKRSDRDVLDIFASLEKRGDLFVYDDYEELQRLNQKKNASTARSHGASGNREGRALTERGHQEIKRLDEGD